MSEDNRRTRPGGASWQHHARPRRPVPPWIGPTKVCGTAHVDGAHAALGLGDSAKSLLCLNLGPAPWGPEKCEGRISRQPPFSGPVSFGACTLEARDRWEAEQRAAHSRRRGSGTTSARRLSPGLWAQGCTSSRASRSRLAWKLLSTSSCCARCASYLRVHPAVSSSGPGREVGWCQLLAAGPR